MLTNPTKTITISQKQIVANAVINQILYTVPAGKTFVGNAFNYSNMQLYVNGIQLISAASATPAQVPLTLVGGSVVSCGGSYSGWSLVGVEQ